MTGLFRQTPQSVAVIPWITGSGLASTTTTPHIRAMTELNRDAARRYAEVCKELAERRAEADRIFGVPGNRTPEQYAAVVAWYRERGLEPPPPEAPTTTA